MKQYALPAAVSLLLACPAALPAELDTVIVTATRTARTADETLASVTVLTRSDIERQQASSVQDLLRGMAGVGITNNGGPGKATSMFLRGTESDHVLVLIDGVRVGSATLGTTAFQDLPVEQIERIEIVRGPRSSLYGSEAIGGVIQIFTRKGGGALRPFFSIGGGRYQTYSASAGVSGGGERSWFNVGASGTDTAGFDARDSRPLPDGAGCCTTDPDRDGYRNLSGSLRAGYRFDSGAELEAHALRAEGKNAFDGSSVNESESVQQVLGARGRLAPLDRWRMSLGAGHSREASDNFQDGRFRSRFDTERDTLSWQNDLTVGGGGLLTLGADYYDDRISGTTVYAVDTRDSTGLFTQYQTRWAAHDAQLSLRRDDNEQFGTQNTGGAAWGYTLSEGLRLTASYGTAFKAPTFNQLYFPDFGNPALQPETSRSIELGLVGKSTWGDWSLNAYETRIDDLIAYDARTEAPANIEQARLRGLEAVGGGRRGGWHLSAHLTLLDPENRSAAQAGSILPRRARQSLRIDLDRDSGAWRTGATLLAEGARYDDLANRQRLGGYTTVDLRAAYRLAPAWHVQARVENLLDTDYETVASYNQAGRGLYLSLRYQPS